MLGWIKYLRRVQVETDALKRNKDLASTRTPLSLVRDEGVAGPNPATPTIFLAQQTVKTGNDMGDETVARRASALLL